MSGRPGVGRYPVTDASLVPVARYAAEHAAQACGLSASVVAQVSLAVTELAENLHRHAVGGEVLLWQEPGRLRVVAVDRGPGVAQFDRCLVDGFTTAGSMGTGLGAVRRLSAAFESHSEPGRGTVVVADFGRPPSVGEPDVAGVGFPLAGEGVNGDAWTSLRHGDTLLLLLCDGLGHGEHAARASSYACAALPDLAGRPLEDVIRGLDDRLRGTRGAAVTVASLSVTSLRDGGEVRSAGLGNVSCIVGVGQGQYKRVITSHGTAGGVVPRTIPVQRTTLHAKGIVVLHTDGLQSRFDLADRPGLLSRSALLVATALWRDYGRGTDDTGVLVARTGADDG